MKLASRFWFIIMIIGLAVAIGACSEKNDGPESPDTPTVPTEPEKPEVPTMSEDEASASLAELMSRCMLAAIDPDAECNDAERLWELIRSVYYQPQTRGVWSTAAGLIKFKQAINNANALYRATLLGAMIETNQITPEARQQIWRVIMDAPAYGSQKLPDAYRVGCEDFWKSFSKGEFDDAAVFIYTAVIAERRTSEATPAEAVATYLDAHDLYEIKMMLRCAGPIIEQGCNIVFAAGDDLISWGQTAYDFVNNNGKVVLEVCKGNLSAETCVDAINTNLKLLSNGLEEGLPQGGDLAGVLSDLTADQVKAFNKAVQDALDTAGATKLSPEDVSWFVTQVQDILGVGLPPEFIDQVFFNEDDMTQLSIESRDGHAYQFFYTDRHGNVLMEGKCSVDSKNISLLVDEDNTDKKCDLLPSSGIPNGGIVVIPYHVVSAGTLVLWYNSSNPRSKYFTIMNDEESEDLFEELTLGIFVTGGKTGTTATEVLRATRSNGAIFGKDDISTSFYGDGLWVYGLKDFKTSEGTTLRHKIEFLLDDNDIFNLSSAKRFSYTCWEIDGQGKKKTYWTMYSNSIPLSVNNRDNAVWLAEESMGNMNVSHLTYRENMRTVCDTYVSNSGTNRIEINVKKGDLPQQLFVNPAKLDFSNTAGEKSISVKRGKYRYFGCFPENGNEDWFSISLDTDSTITVKVTENTTGKDREATLVIWAANATDYEELDPETDLMETVKVSLRQKARELKPHVTEFQFTGGGFNFQQIKEYDEISRSDYRSKGTIQTERVGNGLRITAHTSTTKYPSGLQPEEFTADLTLFIPDCTGESFSEVAEFEYQYNKSENYGSDYLLTSSSKGIYQNIPPNNSYNMGSNVRFTSDNTYICQWRIDYPDLKATYFERSWYVTYTPKPEPRHMSDIEFQEGNYLLIQIEGTDLRLNPE